MATEYRDWLATTLTQALPLKVENLTKSYGDEVAVDDLSFTVEPGRVTGFLGPNGAGKSTTMKILLDLASADRGSATIGRSRYWELDDPPAAGEHLRVLADATGIAKSRVDEMLELVGLTHAAGRAAGAYSLGMRQRLGLSGALLGDATIKDIRSTIFALGTTDSAEDIQAVVTRVVDRAASTLKVRPDLRFGGPVRSLVDEDLAPDVLAVLGETLSNAARHAEATAVTVTLTAGEQVVLTVADNGRGIAEGTPESGLSNIRRRAEQRGGSLTVESARGEGTTICWAVPVR